MTLVLIGPPAAGKSKVGKRLARRLSLPYVDTDAIIVREHGPISEIFRQHGEPHFRRLERAAVAEALHQDAVVSLGGGAVLDPDTERDLADHRVVLLTITPDAVAHRLTSGKRPLSRDLDSWRRLVEARTPVYTSLASFTSDTSHRPVETVVDDILRWMGENTA